VARMRGAKNHRRGRFIIFSSHHHGAIYQVAVNRNVVAETRVKDKTRATIRSG